MPEPDRPVGGVGDALVDLGQFEVEAAAAAAAAAEAEADAVVVVRPCGASVGDGARALDPVAGRRVDVVRVRVAELVCKATPK